MGGKEEDGREMRKWRKEEEEEEKKTWDGWEGETREEVRRERSAQCTVGGSSRLNIHYSYHT